MKTHLGCKSFFAVVVWMVELCLAVETVKSATTAVNYQISAGADDGYAWSATQQDINSSYLMIGDDRTYSAPFYMSAMRFADIGIPRSAAIINARLKISSISEGFRGQIYGLIQAEATDDAADFTARYIGTISKTTVAANWDHKDNWAANTYYTSPDISGVVREVVNRYGWNSGNSMAICYSTRADSGKSRMFGSFEAGAGFAAVLEITYETYSISGYVKTIYGTAFSGVVISAGSEIESTVTDDNGYYKVLVPPGWSGTLTVSKDDVVFKPAQYTYTDLNEDLYEQNFTEYKPKISGYVLDKYGDGLEQANVSANNGGASGFTDADGFYEILVPFNWSGTVTANKSGWKITPDGISYNNLVTDQNDQNYSAYRPTISGNAKDTQGVFMPDVTMDVQGIATLFTDSNGYYQIDVPYKWTGKITPSLTGWGFVPSYRLYPILTIDRTNQDFTAFQPKISGYVLKADGSGMEGAAVTANNGGGSSFTDLSGYYEITVHYNWSGMVSVTKVGYVFIPPNRTYSNVTGNLSNQNYTEFQPVISGYVKDSSGTGVEGVLVSADNSGSDTTDPNGYYEVSVPYNWSGTLTPAKTGWGFNPASQTYSNVISDRMAGDYIAFQPKISGYVTDSSGIGVEGVLVSADNGGGSDTTNPNGYYEVIVPYGFSGTVTAHRVGWEITPVNRDYSNIVSDQTGQDYSAVYVGIFVKEDGTGDFNNIQAAIDFAVDRDIVFVHSGVYTGTGNRDIDFKGKAITVRGVTGDPNDCIIDCQGTEAQPHRGFEFVSGEDANSVLEGFTIANGHAPEENISGFMRSVGGAVYCSSSGPTINNCIIIYNTTAHYGGGICNYNSSPAISECVISNNSAANLGGGIYNRDNSSPIISDCTISNNSGAHYGGGIYNRNNSSPTISNCTISNNSAVAWGGGIYNYDSNPHISNCIINENSAYYGGGIENYNCSNLTIIDCTFSNNSAAYSGGGIRNFNSDSNIRNCVLSNNAAASWGGGICNMESYPIIIDCAILNNSAAAYGGGIFNYSSIPTITKCAISNNTANRGGGICNATSSISNIKNCTINNNTATSSGGGIYNPSNIITINNCIIWGNQPSQISGAANITHSDIQGGAIGVGNINADPCFVDDYHLSAHSPCVDAGDPDYVSEPNETDIDGDPRVVGRLDMGVDEYFAHDSGALFITRQYYEFQVLRIDSNTLPQSLCISNYGALELDWQIEMTDDCDWLRVSALSGQTASLDTNELLISIDHNNIDYGTFSCQLIVSGFNAQHSPQVVTVHLEVLRPELSISDSVFNFTMAGLDSNTAPQVLTIQNTGYDILDWHIEMPNDCEWLKASPLTGQAEHMETDEVILSIDYNNIDYGTYNCQLTVIAEDANNSPQVLTVNLEVLGPVITVSPAQFYFETSLAEPNTTGRIMSIQNTGYDTLNWDVNIPVGCNWLNASEISGQSTGEFDEVVLSIDHNNVERGFHQCEILVSAPDAENSPQVIPVELMVLEMKGQRHVPSEYPTIQAAVDAAVDGDEVIIEPGRYTGPGNYNIFFRYKAITVRSVDPNNPAIVAATIIEPNTIASAFILHCYYWEQGDSIIDGLTIRLCIGRTAIHCYGGNPTIRNCIIEDNYLYDSPYYGVYGVECYDSNAVISNCVIRNNRGSGLRCSNSDLIVRNCIFTGNRGSYTGPGSSIMMSFGGGILHSGGNLSVINCTFSDNVADMGGGIYSSGWKDHSVKMTISNSIFWGNDANDGPQIALINYQENQQMASISYSDVQGGEAAVYVDPCCTLNWGDGNLDIDPCFAEPGYWELNGTPEDANDDFWVCGDYHLKSEAGRWDPNSQTWIYDTNTSPCIDAGDPNSNWIPELWPHGRRINMGACGGTPQASMSLLDSGNIADLIPDGCVGYTDMMLLTYKWLYEALLLAEDLDRNGFVNFTDFTIVANNWQGTLDRAGNPDPADVATGVDPNADLTWTPGFDATSHDVYFGTDNPPPFVGNQTVATFDPGTMTPGTTYYWRINEVGPYCTITGTPWSFTTMSLKATDPNPADGATAVDTMADLNWAAGPYATSHDVYFGTTTPPPFIDNQIATTFDPGIMAESTIYYWRIDEVGTYGTITGTVWSFKTYGPPVPPPPPPPPP